MSKPRSQLIAGCMSGTSLDGVDVAVVRAEGNGLEVRVTPIGFASVPLGDLARRLRAVSEGDPCGASAWAELSGAIGALYADTIAAALSDAGVGASLDLCAVHGQTLHHAPPNSVQLINPWPIALAFGCDVVCDLRGADLAAGGQGAPITPIADWVLFRDAQQDRAIVNLGGFCNATYLRAGGSVEDVRAGDVCACNQVLDRAARRALGEAYDVEGGRAMSGTPDARATDDLMSELERQAGSGRSLGSGDEAAAWVDRHAALLAADDLLATAAAGVGGAIARQLARHAPGAEVLLAGGGAKNAAVVRAIQDQSESPVRRTDDLGIPASYREAIAMAVLGSLARDRVGITLPRVTGRVRPVVSEGVWIRGAR
ncbi:MAG: anhydro-N-acetylmuramic acid kinase [Phycisphaerales bacterium]